MPDQPQILDLPQADRALFGMFAAAVVEASQKDDVKAALSGVFGLLFSNITSEITLKLMLESPPADVGTTVLAYLDPSVQSLVVEAFKKKPQLRGDVETFIRNYQQAMKAEIFKRARAGEKQSIEYLKMTRGAA